MAIDIPHRSLPTLDLDDPRVHRIVRDAVVQTIAHNLEHMRGWFAELLEERFGGLTVGTSANLQIDESTLRAWFEDFVQRKIASDPVFSHKWLAQLIEIEAGRAAQALAQRDKVAFGDWTKAFALGGRSGAQGALDPARDHMDGLRITDIPAGIAGRADLDIAVARDPASLPDTSQREGYHGVRHFDYWSSGLVDYHAIKNTMSRLGSPLAADARVLELGCASGRVLRHFLMQEDGLDVWGCDINAKHVEWIAKHLPSRVCIFQNTVLPSLPIPDASVDVVYAFSVFTHIDEFERSWVAELARVLKPGGIAYLTVHTEHTWSIIDRAGALLPDLLAMNDQIVEYEVSPELFAGPLPDERVVFRWTAALNNNTTVFFSTEHLKRAWGAFLEIVEIVPEGAGYQDVVVLRKR